MFTLPVMIGAGAWGGVSSLKQHQYGYVYITCVDWLLHRYSCVFITCVDWQVQKVEWTSPELHKYGFNFLFDKFKEFYLQEIFPDFQKIDIYKPDLGISSLIGLCSYIDLVFSALKLFIIV